MGIQQLLLGGARAAPGSITYAAAGLYSFTVPEGYTTLNVTSVGGGGGGGGHQGGGDGHIGGIGGSGGYRTSNVSVTPGQVLTVIVGAGGLRASSNFTPSPNTSYEGGKGGTTHILGRYETEATGGWGGFHSGDTDHGDKGTMETWGIFGMPPWYSHGNGRAGMPNGFDLWQTPVPQDRNIGRSGMTAPTGFAPATLPTVPLTVAGVGAEGADGINGGGVFQPQNGTDGLMTISWGGSTATTSINAAYRGEISGALGYADFLPAGGLYDVPLGTATISAYGGWEESYAYPNGISHTFIQWSASSPIPGVTFTHSAPNSVSNTITAHGVPGEISFSVTVTCTLIELPVTTHSTTVTSQISTPVGVLTNFIAPPPPPPQGGDSG